MLTGIELGKALKDAMSKKGVKQADIAQAFDIRQPSVSEWLSTGRIGKKHIPMLIEYFADTVGPDHWGLPFSFDEYRLILAYRDLPQDLRLELLARTQAASEKIRNAGESLLDGGTELGKGPHQSGANQPMQGQR